jgi:threonine dehydrogenase-like Zn-dependent dehydrogenase
MRHVGGVSIGDTVVIEGPGQQGLAGIVAAKHSGAGKIIVTGITKDQRRFEMAKLLGADYCIDVFKTDPVKEIKEITAGMMADVVMDVTGKPEGAKTAINLVKKGGMVVLPGLYGSTNEVPLLLDKVVLEEIRLQGVFSHDITTVDPAIKLVESRKYPLERMVTHKFALKDAEMAVQTAGGEIEGEDPIKVAIIP